jgi:hypothetical protein
MLHAANQAINTDDREYYRGLSNRELIEHADDQPTGELAIVLAERLRAARLSRYEFLQRAASAGDEKDIDIDFDD